MLRPLSKRILAAREWVARQLSRETSSGRFIPEMDGLRFIAISFVVLFHLNGYLVAKWPLVHSGLLAQTSWLADTALVGFRGVELFFVISGFMNLRKYYLRRVTRLEPPYFVALFVLFGLASSVQTKSAVELLPHLAASLFYLHNLIYGAPSVVIGVAWSLEIEVQFYLLVPVLSLVFAIQRAAVRRILLLGVVLGGAFFRQASGRVALSIVAYLGFFLIGFLLADLFVADWREAPTTAAHWDLVTVIGWPLLIAVLQRDALTNWLFPFIVFILYYAAFRGTLTRRVLSNRWITAIGGMCYSIYLIHYEVISMVGRFTRRLGAGNPYWAYLLLQFVLIGIPIVAVCGLYFVLLEKPCMRRNWPRKVQNRWHALFYSNSRAPKINTAIQEG
jgi:peptidoglycan/LPS O-acetylase OafA/YrhL